MSGTFRIFREITEKPGETWLTDQEMRHVRARRLKAGSPMELGDGVSRSYSGRFSGSSWLPEEREPEIRNEPIREIHTALPEGRRWDWLLQKSVELGVTRIQPVIFEHSEPRSFSVERGLRILEEAARQSGRYYLPKLESPIKFTDMSGPHMGRGNWIVCDESGGDLSEWEISSDSCSILIGPEGGFTFRERAKCRREGALLYRIAPYNLRVETAVLAVLSYLLLRWG